MMNNEQAALLEKVAKDFRERIKQAKALMAGAGSPTDWETFADSDTWFYLRKEFPTKKIQQFFEVQWRMMDLDELVSKNPKHSSV